MELCAASLQDYIKGKYQGPMPTDEQVLFQLANGLEYIHSRKILYRGVTPVNILISLTKPVQMKYCDFGLSKPVNENGSCLLSGISGDDQWMMSPEEFRMILNEDSAEDLGRGSVKSDIFSAGCVFIFFLLRGKHSFGDLETQKFTLLKNIVKGDPINVKGS
jgi:serine/threonine protein kinase